MIITWYWLLYWWVDIYDDDDLLIKMLDWRPIEEAIMTYNLDHNLPINDTDFYLSKTSLFFILIFSDGGLENTYCYER